MSDPKRNLVDCVSVGGPPKKLMNVQTIRFVIYDFKDHPAKREELVYSPVLRAHGHLWTIKVYPRGCAKSSRDTEYVSCFMKYAEKKPHKPAAIIDMRCKKHELKGSEIRVFDHCWGYKDFLKRDLILDNYLEEDGSLVIEIDIQLAVNQQLVWYPKELHRQDTLAQLYQDATSETADIIFDVGGKEYRAHKTILSVRAKTLFELSKEYEDHVPVPINFTRRETFKTILDFVYTVKTPEIVDEDTATEILVASDRLDCIDLKLYVESVIVDKFLAPTNAAMMFILADSHSCGLLKEAAMNLFAFDPDKVRESEGWSEIEESNRLLREIIWHISLGYLHSSKFDSECYNNEVDRLDVASLREQLRAANLEVDGSRELLIKRIKEYREIHVELLK
uniref:BTB domain-containing protein n=1 Tax=Pseudo-nitzschia australis TaxID=44445 RepID=A0A7S4AE50_9STRA|mmetsp:Transcript_21883/g.46006  ORF Transcript_21883/g.46006 Transcript_21883/m.46006 type:complete len:393 (-) Transcript_21883:307-1485(-)